jgi:hypothetical protein
MKFLPKHSDEIKKQRINKRPVEDRQFQQVQRIRQAHTRFPPGNHTCAFDPQDLCDIRLFEPSRLPIFAKTILELMMIVAHTPFLMATTSSYSSGKLTQGRRICLQRQMETTYEAVHRFVERKTR